MRFASSTINNRNFLIPEGIAKDALDYSYYPINHFDSFDPQPTKLDYHPSNELLSLLNGRHLLIDEIPFSLDILHDHYMNGYLQIEAGIQLIAEKPTCVRCGSKDAFGFYPCARCKSNACRYCRQCIMMGRVSACSPLYHCPMTTRHYPPTSLHWDGKLSQGQQEASEQVKVSIQKNSTLLVWAVCGSGKTEVLFKGLEAAIGENKTICIATPRTDVVLELLPRLRKVFPNIELSGLYAGSTDPLTPFIISTTHQLIRYKNAFDVMIIDEVDAFPFEYDPTLQYAVQKSMKDSGALIYLTATPSKKILKQVSELSLPHVRIPARFHGYALPIPTFVWIGNWRKSIQKGKVPKLLVQWIKKQFTQNKPVMLFIPSIKLLEQVQYLFETVGFSCEAVHSEDPERVEKVKKFRAADYPLLLTTTILERGVTIENVSIGVLGAEAEIFTESALVQIAGRAGRSEKYPDGEIAFFHFGKTNDMLLATRHITRMNVEAERRGWLK
ncbi:DEAD/DEAH box helicase [Alkalihalobacillus sp. R86527]|uniref:DEAD/DEAH box helicase n=1 Tax=Alkalihalobacillus sp. R86527 TaxID=3093863 RepID=UPI00366CF65C